MAISILESVMSIIEDFKTQEGLWVKSFVSNDVQYVTKGYKVWNHVNTRCKVGGAAQRKQPSYVGCHTEGLFKCFQKFMDWYVNQVGYGLPRYHLDKDILVRGNKCYSESTCVLVPQSLNSFLLDHAIARGRYPQGVSWHKAGNGYLSNLNIEGKKKHLGIFPTASAAAKAYKVAKEAEAYRWYERLIAGEYAVDPRVIERMRTWEHICDWTGNDYITV